MLWEYQAAAGKGNGEKERQQSCIDAHKLKAEQT